MSKKYFLDLTKDEIEQIVLSNKEKSFCVDQIIDWVYQKKEKDFLKFSNLSKNFREKLCNNYTLTVLNLVLREVSKKDGTTRFNFKTKDNYFVPTVFLPNKDRNVVCISTQVGCSIGCYFCNSGKKKFVRNLTRGEILEQIINVEILTNKKVGGVLFMGMGEPLLNYDNVIDATRMLMEEKMFAIGRKHITISTIGLVPKIYNLSDEKLGVRLAISLHSPNDETRAKLVPGNVKYGIEEILKAGIHYMTKNNTDLTVEYVLIQGINDSTDLAQELVKVFNRLKIDKMKIKINLIPNNDIEETKFKKPSKETILEFQKVLEKNKYLTFIRKSRGDDIKASCGQLGF
ncbi:MAG: 23S rRNA (adenine(2503)-C(2))-methyltransferase RlmN [Endomicrobiia bacterium]